MSTKTTTVPQAGKVYRYGFTSPGATYATDYLMFVTEVSVTEHMWVVRGYRLTRQYALTGEAVTESDSIGQCAPGPLFSDRFPASDASLVGRAERLGRAEYMG